jgi:Raf kinase inhibitor-like YbhB/YbcL family protein
MIHDKVRAFLCVALALGGAACPSERPPAPPGAAGKLEVTSTALAEGQPIPAPYACTDYDHLGKSPPLAWSAGPEGTAGYVVTAVDPDAKGFVHWALVSIPAGVTSLPEGASPGGSLPAGAIDLPNDFDKKGYGGPCPPPGKPHHYVFQVTAVKKPLAASKADGGFFQELAASTLASGSITVTFHR